MSNTTILAVIIAILLILLILCWKNKEALQDHLWSRLPWKFHDDFRVMLFYTNTCPACVELKTNVWPRILQDFPDLNIQEVNCEEDPAMCMKYGVTSYPSILLFRGETHQAYTGGWNYSEMAAVFKAKNNRVDALA